MYVCPVTKKPLVQENNFLICKGDSSELNQRRYEIRSGIPILIPYGMEFSVFSVPKSTTNQSLNLGSQKRDMGGILANFKSFFRQLLIGSNEDTRRNYRVLANSLGDSSSRVLVVGGGTVGSGAKDFYEFCESNEIWIESIDVYISPNCTAVADAHYLPFADESFDVVIIQAVLEHVVNPQKVVSEVHRVLRENGLVYAETPFMQCVHEGPFDFMRFTNSGHRYLFRHFNEVKAGAHHGAFSSALFIFSYAISGLARTRYAGVLLRVMFGRLVKFLDAMTSDEWNIDVACGNYFIGEKAIVAEVAGDSTWIVKYYKGAQKK